MKRLTTIFILAVAFVLAACTSDDSLSVQSGEAVTVTYAVALPEDIGTRVYSDGETAVYLSYGVYDEDNALVLSEERAAVIANKAATVTMQLLKDHTYNIVFWADAGKSSNYTIDFETQTVSMNYDAVTEEIEGDEDSSSTYNIVSANDENRDAFWAVEENVVASTSVSRDVALRRPFAQLNFGTDDLSAKIIRQNYAISNTVFTLTMPAGSLANTFNLLDGSVSEATSNATKFTCTGIPAYSDGEFPVSGYEYLQMNYLLPYVEAEEGEDASAADKVIIEDAVTLTAALSDDVQPTVSVTNMPLQRNYRTNVYGSLLTNPKAFSISINEAYDDHYCIKDGTLYYCVESADDLIAAIEDGQLAILLNEDITISTGITLSTATLINLNGHTLTIDISTAKAISAAYNLTILNGTLDITSSLASSTVYGIYLNNSATLTIDNVALSTTSTVNTYCLYNTGNGTVTINNSSIAATATEASKSAGGVYNMYGKMTITDSEITATSKSIAYGAYNYYGTMTITDSKITAISTDSDAYGITSGYDSTTDISNSEITATASSSAYGVNNETSTTTITDCKITATSTNGDVFCVCNTSGTIDISNSEIIANGSTAHGIYNGNTSYSSAIINISGSTITVTSTNGTAYGAYNTSGTINISDCEITVNGSSGAYNTNNVNTDTGTITIDGVAATNS